MNSRTTERFRRTFALLPETIRKQARAAYRLFRDNARHPSLQFKKVHPHLPVYSVRVNLEYRAVGVLRNDDIVWFWIGTHKEYEQVLRSI